jgi:hypothetical protein
MIVSWKGGRSDSYVVEGKGERRRKKVWKSELEEEKGKQAELPGS